MIIATLTRRHRRQLPDPASCAVLALALAALSGCQSHERAEADTRKSIVVLVDKTASTSDNGRIFALAIDRIIDTLRPGDCIRISPITESSSRDWVDAIEFRVPDELKRQNLILDNTLEYRTRQRRHAGVDSLTRARLREGASRLLELPSDRPCTAIFETLRIAAQVFAGEDRPRRILVLLSDMLETSAINFRRLEVDDQFTTHLIAEHQERHLLPELGGVSVYAVGLGTASLEQMVDLERFWTRYVTAAGGTIPPGAIGRAVPVFAN